MSAGKDAQPAPLTVLYYLGYDNDRGGIVSFVRALAPAAAASGKFSCALGMNEGARISPRTAAAISAEYFPPIAGETISPATMLRARTVARAAQAWLRADSRRVFHGCSRAGLLVALWLARWGERRAAATVHCYGRQRWFYRFAARRLGARLRFIAPTMSRYYGLPEQTWDDCLPPCIRLPDTLPGARVSARAGAGILRAAGIGALVPVKRWDLVLDALALLPAETRARWIFSHIGSDDGSGESLRCAASLRARTRDLGLGARVRWLGQQPSPEALLRETDLLLVASDREALSVARTEALAAGVPSLSADSGAAADVVRPPVNGWLFRNGDAHDLARMLEKLSAPGALGEARIDREGLRRFSAEASAEQHACFYGELLADKPGAWAAAGG